MSHNRENANTDLQLALDVADHHNILPGAERV